MFELKGDKCPLLFDKWRPERFVDYKLDKDGKRYSVEMYAEHVRERLSKEINQVFHFPFCTVEMHSYDALTCQPRIVGRQRHLGEKHTPELLFRPENLQMYHAAKEWMKPRFERVIEQLRKVYSGAKAEGTFDSYWYFQRITGMQFDLDIDKFKMKKPGKRRKVAKKIYQSLEDRLAKQFGIATQRIEPLYFFNSDVGKLKEIKLGNGVYFIGEKIGGDFNSGTVYITITSDEHGIPANHHAVVEACRDYLKTVKKGSYSFVNGQGTHWEFNPPKIIRPNGLPYENVFVPLLTQQ